ncbi:hypothetical protein A5886_001892 [Enterococcus sp. 8G7_MSG3316]|uniref:Plasmid pRiA4b Orf3-like domain-containing protein n=1 Tax=Candidatus Enterococcus testudinis TaxID=1834191 RepID=A0A242A875_9ENTE|nr:plasmid pRiA4b ORF-3 family protein [Enterococcus sp. 8G7_MSG3316]OTN76813.1 hypothetical protein A5886_001892 [Enterococcus sp. 8G7_MSG3316]
MEKTLKKLAKVIDRMMDHVDLYGGPSIVSDDNLEHYLDPVFYLIFCAETAGGLSKLKDKAFVTEIYTEFLPQELPYNLRYIPFAKSVMEDFYYCLYKEKHITKAQYLEMAFIFAEKQTTFFARMTIPQFWSEEKQDEMMARIMEEEPEEHDLLPIDDPRIAAVSKKVVPFPNQKTVFDEEDDQPAAYQIRIDLEGYRPPIWRRLVIPAGISYEQLHLLIQIAFEWMNEHLYLFFAGQKSFGVGISAASEKATIDQDFQECKSLTYIYDMGADWTHKIKIEKILKKEDITVPYYPVCIKAVGDSPVEDMFEDLREPLDREILNEQLADYWETGELF